MNIVDIRIRWEDLNEQAQEKYVNTVVERLSNKYPDHTRSELIGMAYHKLFEQVRFPLEIEI